MTMLMPTVESQAVFVSASWCFNSRLSVFLVCQTPEAHPGLWDFPVLLVHKTTNRPASAKLNVKKKKKLKNIPNSLCGLNGCYHS